MLNLPGSRKYDDRKKLKSLIMKTKRLTLIYNENFKQILSSFQSFFNNESSIKNVENTDLNQCIRQLLSSLRSIPPPLLLEIDDEIEKYVIKSLNRLQKIYCDDSVFPETAILSAFCTPFILMSFLSLKYRSNIDHDKICRISFVLYTQMFAQSIEDDEFVDKIQQIIGQTNPIVIVEHVRQQIDRIESTTTSFCQATFYYGILNCVPFFNVLIEDSIEIFAEIFIKLIRLCRIETKQTFQIYRLLNQYLKLLNDHQHAIENQILNNKNLKNFLSNIVQKTLSIVDSEWESPINGAITLMKENYQFLIRFIIQTRLEDEKFIEKILIEQIQSASQLPFTSKAKYKKLAVLTEFLSVQTKNDQFKLLPGSPFEMDSNFSDKMIKHLSITAITTSIADYYKCSISWILSSARIDDNERNIQEKWSQIWLRPITQIFRNDQIQFMIVHNIMMASILPATLQHIPQSMSLMMEKLSDCPYGQVCLIRIYLEKYSQITESSPAYELPSINWLITILTNQDDMIRVEGLALLADEKLIKKNRPIVCDLILRFLRNNLNVDNSSFRQRMIRVLERFFFKIITCLCDRYGGGVGGHSQSINQEHKPLVSFISNTLRLLAISLSPGSSFQRKSTALNLIAAIITLIKSGDYHLTIRRLLTNDDHDQQELIEPIPIRFMLLYGIIDKDDKIRRSTNEILIQYSKTSLVIGQDDRYQFFSTKSVENLSIHYGRSFRHQECHIGGLLCRYLIQINPVENIHHIFTLVRNANKLFYSDSFRKQLLKSSQTNPLHGWLLTLNQCLDFDNLAHHLLDMNPSCQNGPINIRYKIVEPTIELCFDVLEYFLALLTPKNGDEDVDFEYPADDGDGDGNYSSPSFLEMSESIRQIVQKETEFDNEKDFTMTNEFQLILSMCWLNMKESCFLIANLSKLSADLLYCMINRTDYKDIRDFLLLSAEKLCQSIIRMVNLMQRCRHRGVIEACSVSLTKFTRSLLRIYYYLHQMVASNSSVLQAYRSAMEIFVQEIFAVIARNDKSRSKISITRRSAGLALIIQSVLIGEAESFQKDKIKLSNNNSCPRTLYEQFIDLLIQIAQSPITNDDDDDVTMQEKIDLPQANAMHVLRSILGTSVLSQMNYKTAEILFPICLNGFTSTHWQIRNASLQLFGSCITRLLGQKKRTKSKPMDNDDDDNDVVVVEEESTITLNEFYSRYPNLLKLICQHFEQSSSYENHRPEIVPVLALIASFTSFAQFHSFHDDDDQHAKLIEMKNCLKKSFIQYVEKNRCWKIRMLAARSLANLSTFEEMNEFLHNSFESTPVIKSNHYHGLLYCAKYMIEQHGSQDEIEFYRQKLYNRFKQHSQSVPAFHILRPLFLSIFNEKQDKQNNNLATKIDESNNDDDDDQWEIVSQDLHWILERTSFKNPDNIRFIAAKQMNQWLRQNNNADHDIKTLILIAEIVLTLLEDEDRHVRFEALKIGEIIFHDDQKILSTNITINMFIDWLIKSNHNGYRALFELILKRFAQSLSYVEQQSDDQMQNDVLFEKEEKNVFAEPYLMNIRLLNAFLHHQQSSNEIIHHDFDRDKFEKIYQRFRKQFDQHDQYESYRNDIMFKGIWRLPKYFLFLVDHLLFMRLALSLEPENGDYQKQESSIHKHNPFYLQELLTEFHPNKMDLIHFSL